MGCPQLNDIYYGHRYYDADMGRWLSRDPLNEYGSRNLYEFINNDSINRVDYLGLVDLDDAAKLYLKLIIKAYNNRGTTGDKVASQFIHKSLLAGALYNKSFKGLKYTGEFFKHYLGHSGEAKFIDPPKVYFEEKVINKYMKLEIIRQIKKKIKNKDFSYKEIKGSSEKAIQPKDRDMRLTVGHTHIHFKMKMTFFSKEMLCGVSSTWWIDDKYDFNKDVFNYGGVKFPEKIFHYLEQQKLAKTFQTRAIYYGAALAKMGGMKLTNGAVYTNIKKFLSFKFADKPIISDTPKPPKWDK